MFSASFVPGVSAVTEVERSAEATQVTENSRAVAPNETASVLYPQIRQARFWLPLAIMGVVLFYQLAFVPLGGESWQFWSVLLFYSVLGPVVTFITLDWIGSEVRQREEAQLELAHLYTELRSSHALLGAIQRVTEQFASAQDLESALSAASEGVTRVTGAVGAAVFLRPEGIDLSRSYRLSAELERDAVQRDRALLERRTLSGRTVLGDEEFWLLSAPIIWGDKPQGSVHAYYTEPVESEQRESFSILTSEFSAAAEAARSRTRDLLTLVEVDRSIRAEGNLERLLSVLLTQLMVRADATTGGVYLLADERLQLRVCHGVSCEPGGAPVRLGEGFIGAAAAAAEPRTVCELSGETLHPLLEGAGSAVALPLSSENELLGIVVLAHAEPRHFDEESLPFLNLVAGQVSLAVRNANAYLQSEELAIVEERARIAREIHDGVAQSLAVSALNLDLVSRLYASDPDKAAQQLDETKANLRELIKEVRRSIFALRPVDLETYGLVETVQRYLEDYGQQNEIRVDLELGPLPQLSTKSEAVLFRIFQEAMHNVAKHAYADTVKVTLGTARAQGFVSVKDNGVGFNLRAVTGRVTSAGGLGLKQMRERVEGRGGTFRVKTHLDEGTSVYASLPS